jgi:hypothetical protein
MTYPTKPCRGCTALIVWAVSATTGGQQPIGPEPHPDGSVELVPRSQGAPLARVVPATRREGRTDLHRPHHQTCPAAKPHRRKPAAS